MFSAADTRAVIGSFRGHITAVDIDVNIPDIVAAADTRAVFACGRLNGTAPDGNRTPEAAAVLIAGADTRRVRSAVSFNIAVVNGNMTAVRLVAAADARRVAAAVSNDVAPVDVDVAGAAFRSFVPIVAADTCKIITFSRVSNHLTVADSAVRYVNVQRRALRHTDTFIEPRDRIIRKNDIDLA